VGLKEPQAVPSQPIAHFTCGLAEVSFLMKASHDTAAFTCNDAGIGDWNKTEIAMGGEIAITAEIDLVGSAAAVAVIVTVPPGGITEGAVYTIAPTSSLEFEVPHALELPQLIE
jgi:hypothetical protein